MDAPDELKASGRAMWDAIAEARDIDFTNHALVLNACRIVDRLDELTLELSRSTLTVVNQRQDRVANPLLTEQRQQLMALKAIMATLGLGSLKQSTTGKMTLKDQLKLKREEREQRQA